MKVGVSSVRTVRSWVIFKNKIKSRKFYKYLKRLFSYMYKIGLMSDKHTSSIHSSNGYLIQSILRTKLISNVSIRYLSWKTDYII